MFLLYDRYDMTCNQCSNIVCPHTGECSDYPYKCQTCSENTGKKSYYKPRPCAPYDPYVPYIPYIPYEPYPPPYVPTGPIWVSWYTWKSDGSWCTSYITTDDKNNEVLKYKESTTMG